MYTWAVHKESTMISGWRWERSQEAVAGIQVRCDGLVGSGKKIGGFGIHSEMQSDPAENSGPH